MRPQKMKVMVSTFYNSQRLDILKVFGSENIVVQNVSRLARRCVQLPSRSQRRVGWRKKNEENS
jgi:hypothetical protein